MKRLLLAAAFCAAATPALALFDTAAPGLVQIVDPAAPNTPLGTASHPLNTTATLSGATIGGFQPSAAGSIGTPVSVTTTSSAQTLPTGTVVIATNVGVTGAFCQLGAVATVNSQYLAPNGGWFAFTVGSATQISCLTSTSTTTVNTLGGAGIASGTGGGGGGGGGGNVTITGPLGTQTIGSSVAVTPATASQWNGPLGTQVIANSQAINPATSSVFSTINGPDPSLATANLTAVDVATVCTALPDNQTVCTGVPTANSVLSVAITAPGAIAVSGSVSGGTYSSMQTTTEVSADNVNWFGRGLFLDSNTAPIWRNNIQGGTFMGFTPAGGVKFYRVRVTALTVATGAPVEAISIAQGQAYNMQYCGNCPASGAGANAAAAFNVQGETGGIPVGVNVTQQAGSTLAAPTAPGVPASSGLVPTVNVANPGSTTVAGFSPDALYSTSLAVTNVSGTTPLPSTTVGEVIKIYNRGPNTLFWTKGASPVATNSMSMLAPNSWDSFVVKAGDLSIAAIVNLASQSATLNAESGTGTPSGTGGPIAQANLTIGQAVSSVDVIGGVDNTGVAQPIGATAAGTSTTKDVAAIQGVTGGVPVPISGSVTASFSQFAPNGNYSTPLTVGAASARTALPAGGGTTVGIYNTGSNAAFVQLGNAAVVATASNDQVAPGGFLCFAVGANVDIAAIETAGATTLNISGGSGGCAGSGGGGGGGSGGGVSAADNSTFTPNTTAQAAAGGVATATPTVGAVTTGHQGAVGMSLNREQWVDTGTGSNLYAAVTGSIPAGANLIGKVGIDQTTPGTTNGVVVNNTVPVAPSPYPATAVPITASATGTTAATTATLTNVTGHTTYICGYSVRANATAATTVLDTITGVITATMSGYLWVAPNASGIGVDEQIFSPCIPASAISTSIAVISGAPGAGGLVSVKAWGYSL